MLNITFEEDGETYERERVCREDGAVRIEAETGRYEVAGDVVTFHPEATTCPTTVADAIEAFHKHGLLHFQLPGSSVTAAPAPRAGFGSASYGCFDADGSWLEGAWHDV